MRALLNDICELVMEQVELYRDTRESILMDPGSRSALDFVSNEKTRRENALRKRMVLDGNLHPALQQPDGNYKVRCMIYFYYHSPLFNEKYTNKP